MAELSKGKQHCGPSGLRNVQQAPGSDRSVPETRVAAAPESEYGGHDADVPEEDLALMAKLSCSKPAGGPTQPSTSLQLFVRPSSATTERFNPFARLAPNKTLPKEDTPAVKPPVHPDTAVPSVEPPGNGTSHQDVHASPVPSSWLPSPTIEERVADKPPTPIEGAHDHDRGQLMHEESAVVEAPHTEPIQAKPLRAPAEPHTAPNSTTQAAPIPKKKRNGTKAKKVKKTLLSRPLQPWPRRSGLSSGQSNTQAAAVPSAKQATPEQKAEVDQSTRSVEDLAVKSQPGGACVPDGPLELEEEALADDIASPIGATDGSHAADGPQAMSFIHTERTETAVQRHPDADVQQPTDVTESSIHRHDSSMLISYESHDQRLQAQQCPVADSQAPKSSLLVSGATASLRSRTSRPRQALKPTQFHHARHSAQHIPSNNEASKLVSVDDPASRSRSTQEVLHGASSRSGPVRVMKAPKQTQVTHDAYLRMSTANGNHQTHPRTTALELALDTLRTACLTDQYRLEDQMTSRENEWKGEKLDFQTTITKQLETIAEQRVKLEQSEKRFAHLTDKLKSSQKFISGLQIDHEKLQKSMVAFQEQNKRALQDQIVEMLREKEDLQGTLEAMVDSCAKSRKGMLRTMHELQLRYVTALSRENNLKDRLDERVTMYEEEKNRRTELEQQLLSSVQSMQRHLNESSAALAEKIGSLRASMETRAAKDGSDSTVKECLLILQKLQSLPLLISNHVSKAESMIRYLDERTDAGFERVIKSSEGKAHLIEDIRQCMRDQTQGLQAEILRHHQAIADGQLAREANQSLMTEVETEKQKNQQLEEQVATLQQSKATLKTCITELENERDQLQTAVQEHEARPREFEQKIAQLQERLSGVKDDLRQSNANVERFERRHLEQERQFCKYRVDALAHLASLREHLRQTSDHGEAKDRECDAFKQDAANLRIELESEQTKTNQLMAEIYQHSSAMRAIKQEKNDAIEKEGRMRDSLRSAEDSVLELEIENHKLSSELKETRTGLRTSKNAEQKLTSQCSGLQRQLGQLQDTKTASDEQLRQMQHDMDLRLQQAKTDHNASLDDLNSRLALSECARKELQAKLRQVETGHKQQIEYHEQKFNAKFDSLAAQSQQEHEKLKTEHTQEMESCKQHAETMIANMRFDAENKAREAQTRIDEMIAETEKRLIAAGLPTSRILVPNTQQSEQNGGSSSQQSKPGRTSKKVDRQTNSVTVTVATDNRRLDTVEGGSVINIAAISDRRREGSESEVGYFKEEYECRFGPQGPLQDQETQVSLVEPEAEVVPETQDFEYGQGVAVQFEMNESQVIASDNVDQEENLTDLSTMPSEDLSEMLLDIHPTSRQQRHTPKHVSSPTGELRTLGQSAHDVASDAHSTNSQGRPKSRANTASRMMPLPAHGMQCQRAHADEGPRHLSHARAERSFGADNNDSPDFMHPNNATSKRKYAQRSAHDTDSGRKRKATGSIDENGSFKKLRTSTQAFAQRPSSIPKGYAPYTPALTSTPAQNNSTPSPVSVTGRRSSYRQSSRAGSQGATPRLSSTQNTRSKSNRYADRFADKLDRP